MTERQSTAQISPSNVQLFKFSQDTANIKKDQNEDYHQMNSLVSNNLSTYTPYSNDGRELATLSKLEFKKPDL